jgi:hypothetical protein
MAAAEEAQGQAVRLHLPLPLPSRPSPRDIAAVACAARGRPQGNPAARRQGLEEPNRPRHC